MLFVDDDRLMLTGIRQAFRGQVRVETAASGQAALDLLRGAPPAVAVVDQQMPGMSGIELLGRLREAHPDTVRVMLTGQADFPTALEAVNRGQVFRFLTKPVHLPSLQKVVAESLLVFQQRQEENHLMAEALANRSGEGADPEAAALRHLLETRLTPRELEVLRGIGLGEASKEIGPRLGISHRTVDVHRYHILKKLGLHNAPSLVRMAARAGLV